MYPYIIPNVVLVKGPSAYGVYDLNNGLFHRLTIAAGDLLCSLDGEKAISLFTPEEREFFEIARTKGIVDYQASAEYRKKTSIDEVLREGRTVKFAWIELTSVCNQRCIHCFMGDDLNAYKHLELEKICEFIDILYSQGISQLILTGGEPTLHPDFELILDYVSKYDMSISLLTNGITEQLVKAMPKLRAYGIKSKISILGWENTHDVMVGVNGAFKKLMRTIDKYVETRTPIELGMTVCSVNLRDVDIVREYANEKGIKLEVSPIYPTGKARDNYDILFQHTQREFISVCQRDKKRVTESLIDFEPAERYIKPTHPTDYESVDLKGFLTNSFECGQKIIAILSSGKVSPCLLLRKSPYYMGDVNMSRLEDILHYQSKERQLFNQKMLLSNISDCSKCEALYICKGGGCIAITEAKCGSINHKNPFYSQCYYCKEGFDEK